MAWQDELIPAKLNGVPFFVKSAGKQGGRRSRAHEFADVDGAWVEDSGGMPHRYQIDAFIVGSEYHVTLQQLEEVLDGPGPLDFDHPRRGPIGSLYLEGTYDTEETTDKGGFARVSFTLVQAGQPEPLIFASIPAGVKVASQRVREAAKKQFKKKYKGRLFGGALRFMRRLSNALKRSYGNIMAAFGPVAALRDAVNAIDDAIDQIVGIPGDIANLFDSLAQSFMNLFSKAAKDMGRPEGAPQALAKAAKDTIDSNKTPEAEADYDSVVGSETTPSGKALEAKIDLDSIGVLWGSLVIASLCEALVDLPLPNADAADALGELVVGELDILLAAEVGNGPVDQELYDELLNLKVKVTELLTEVGGQLPPVTTYVLPTTTNVVTAAFNFSGSTGQALSDLVASILDLNDVDTPIQIPDGTPLKVVVS